MCGSIPLHRATSPDASMVGKPTCSTTKEAATVPYKAAELSASTRSLCSGLVMTLVGIAFSQSQTSHVTANESIASYRSARETFQTWLAHLP